MTRTAETAIVLATSGLAAFGVSLVNFAEGGGLDAQPALTFLVFALAFGGLLAAVRTWAHRAVTYLIPPACLLTAVGFVIIYRLDHGLATLQRWWMLVGTGCACLFLYALRSGGLARLRRRFLTLGMVGVGLLSLPLLPVGGFLPLSGLEINGSRLWVEWDAWITFAFQPGEIAKLLLVVFLVGSLAESQPRFSRPPPQPVSIPQPAPPPGRQLPWLIGVGIAGIGLLTFQGDPAALLLLLGGYGLMLSISTSRFAYAAASLGIFGVGFALVYLFSQNLQDRVTAWINPWGLYEGAGFPVAQALFSLGNGHLTGSGLGLGRPDLIPSASTDYVLAALAEELGLAGTVGVICAFGVLAAAGFGVAVRSADPFRKLLAAGLALLLAGQVVLILGGVLRLLPPTALPTPFMSYGIVSLPAGFLWLALLLRISHEEHL